MNASAQSVLFNDRVERLYGLQRFGVKMGLTQIRALLEASGKSLDAIRFIHVAGTNGKGSVCALLEAALIGAGRRVGFYSSPHLISPRERFRVDGHCVSETRFVSLVDAVWPRLEALREQGGTPTYFEAVTAMAAEFFVDADVEFAVWETGMGGRLDATNAVTPVLTIITGIGLDHERYLGNTEAEIAAEKAGIIKPGVPVVLGPMGETARGVIIAAARHVSAPVLDVDISRFALCPAANPAAGWEGEVQGRRFAAPLAGMAQRRNIPVALTALEYLTERFRLDLPRALAGLKNTRWMARFQTLPDGNLLDGAHNVQGVTVLRESLDQLFPGRRFRVIFGCLDGKDPVPMLRLLAPVAEKFIFSGIACRTRETMSPERLALYAAEACPEIPAETASSAAAALGRAVPGETLIVGSLYLAGEILSRYYTEEEIIHL